MKLGASLLAVALCTACSGQTIVKGGDGGTSSSSSGGSSGGGSGSSSGGGSGSSSGSGFGCPNDFTTTASPVNPTLCEPQLSSTTSCMGMPCSWQVEVPCTSDAGGADDAAMPCMDWCNSVAPAGAGPAGFCTVQPLHGGGVAAQCGGCGI